jgi:hypothetical protein
VFSVGSGKYACVFLLCWHWVGVASNVATLMQGSEAFRLIVFISMRIADHSNSFELTTKVDS